MSSPVPGRCAQTPTMITHQMSQKANWPKIMTRAKGRKGPGETGSRPRPPPPRPTLVEKVQKVSTAKMSNMRFWYFASFPDKSLERKFWPCCFRLTDLAIILSVSMQRHVRYLPVAKLAFDGQDHESNSISKRQHLPFTNPVGTLVTNAVADPGFPVGGACTRYGRAWTSDAGTFRQKCMQKRKNWVP